MRKMKQKVNKKDAELTVPLKKTKTSKVSPRKKKETNHNEKTDVPMVNGKENRKRKIETEVNEVQSKKSRNAKEHKIPEVKVQEPQSYVDENKVTVPSENRTAKSEKIIVNDSTATVSSHSVQSSTSNKRQKVTLQVPTLPTISGVLFVMGDNDVGQIGMDISSVHRRKHPTELLHPTHQFVDIAAGAMHSVCLTSLGEVYTFGCNDEGALGRLTEEQEDEFAPEKVNIPGVVVKVSAGDSHSAALTENGHVYIWGNFRNSNGMIGLLRSDVKNTTPQRILRSVTVVHIASGADHFVCLSNDGHVYTCGNAESGQLGRISERSAKGKPRRGFDEHLEPRPIMFRPNLTPISDVWVGPSNTYFKVKDGSIYACGLNNYHQLGLPIEKDSNGEPTKFIYFIPTLVSSFNANLNWQRICAGQHHAAAQDGNGCVYSLGRKEYGRLGLGEDCKDAETLTVIPTLQNKNSVDISCGNIVTFAVTDDGVVHSWGFGENYQLGHGNANDVYVPTPIGGNFQNSWFAIKVSGGGQHTLILANKKGASNNTEIAEE